MLCKNSCTALFKDLPCGVSSYNILILWVVTNVSRELGALVFRVGNI